MNNNFDLETGVFSVTSNGEIAIIYQGQEDANANNLFLNSYTIITSAPSTFSLSLQATKSIASIEGVTQSVRLAKAAYSATTVADGLVISYGHERPNFYAHYLAV